MERKFYRVAPSCNRWTEGKLYTFEMDEYTGEWITTADTGSIVRVSFAAISNPHWWEEVK